MMDVQDISSQYRKANMGELKADQDGGGNFCDVYFHPNKGWMTNEAQSSK